MVGIALTGTGTYAATVISSKNVGYTDNSNLGVNNVQDALDILYEKTQTSHCPDTSNKTTINFKVGDYVKMTPISTTYTTNTGMTGYDSTQTINPSELNLWRVIRKNSDGTVDMISQYVSSTAIYFKGTTGYTNYVGYLNTLAGLYENSCYTVGSRNIGYDGQTSYIKDTSKIISSTVPWTANTSSTVATNEVLGGGDTLYTTDTGLVTTAIGNLTAYKAGTTTATAYWVSSRYYYYTSSGGIRWFCGRYVNTSGSVATNSQNMFFGYTPGGTSTNPFAYSLRPIVTLKSGIKASGSGTSASPYILN